MRSGHFEVIWSSLASLLVKLANCKEGFLGCYEYIFTSPNQVLTHAARAAAKQPPLVAARGAREGLWL